MSSQACGYSIGRLDQAHWMKYRNEWPSIVDNVQEGNVKSREYNTKKWSSLVDKAQKGEGRTKAALV